MKIKSLGCSQLAVVASLLSGCKPFKATSSDDIPAYILKETANQIAPSLTQVFKASLIQSKLPSDWKTAHVVPEHKKGDRSPPNNYRPISLTSYAVRLLNILSQQTFTRVSDKRNLITAKATGLILLDFFIVQRRFGLRGAFWHTAVCTMHSSWTYQCPLCPIHLR